MFECFMFLFIKVIYKWWGGLGWDLYELVFKYEWVNRGVLFEK